MIKLKKLLIFLTFITIIFANIPVFAEENPDEPLDENEMNQIIEEAAVEVQEVPRINSRHAVVYDRVTRKSFIL